MRLKWTEDALAADARAKTELSAAGYRIMRTVYDPACQSLLRFWSRQGKALIQQTWTQTGDVVYWTPIEDPFTTEAA